MWGAIIGDLAGSIYEFGQIKQVSNIKPNTLIEKNAFFSDDTILTVAVADAILTGHDYERKLKAYITKYENYRPNFSPYFQTAFSPKLIEWAKGNVPGHSSGNGAMMRIAPVGHFFNTEEDVVKNAVLATVPSHNSREAVNCAIKVALAIFYARKGFSKNQIMQKLGIRLTKPHLTKFNYTCADTIDLCFCALFTTDNFEDAIKQAIAFGGDTDTNACIVGSIAEPLYGIDEKLKQKAKAKLPNEFLQVINQFYAKTKNVNHEITKEL